MMGNAMELDKEAASLRHACLSLSMYDAANLCTLGREEGEGK